MVKTIDELEAMDLVELTDYIDTLVNDKSLAKMMADSSDDDKNRLASSVAKISMLIFAIKLKQTRQLLHTLDASIADVDSKLVEIRKRSTELDTVFGIATRQLNANTTDETHAYTKAAQSDEAKVHEKISQLVSQRKRIVARRSALRPCLAQLLRKELRRYCQVETVSHDHIEPRVIWQMMRAR